MITIEVECPTCEAVFKVEDFDETKEIEDTTCPECEADLEISEYDPLTQDYSIEDVTDLDPEPQDDETEEEAGLIVTGEEEEEEPES